MKRYSFGSFVRDEGNAEAMDLCKEVAELKPVSPLPILLLGGQGSGKTHLLWSIINHVKAHSARVGLAYVIAFDFPKGVRDLVHNPAPVQKTEHAILLVDQLEQFTELVDELEAVIRLFIEHGHYVLIASNAHPRRIAALPASLQELCASGQTVVLQPHEHRTQTDVLRQEARTEQADELIGQEEEIDNLRQLLASAHGEAPPGQVHVQELEAENNRLREALEAAQDRPQDPGPDASAMEALRTERDEARREAEETRCQLDNLQQRLAGYEALEQAAGPGSSAHEEEVAALRRRIMELEEELAALREGHADETARLAEACDDARREVEIAKSAREEAERRAAELREQAASYAQEIAELQDEVSQLRAASPEADIEAERTALEEERRILNDDLREFDTARQQFHEERRRVVESGDAVALQQSALESQRASLDLQAHALEEARQVVFGEGKRIEATARGLADRAEHLAEQAAGPRDRLVLLRQEVDRLQETFFALKDRFESLGEEHASALASLSEAKTLRDKAAEWETGEAELQRRLEEAQAECERLRSDAEEAAVLRDEREQLHGQAEELRAAAAESQANRERLEEEVERTRRESESERRIVRDEAAAQIAEQHAYACELEARIARLEDEVEAAREKERRAGEDLRRLHECLAEAVHLAARWSGAEEAAGSFDVEPETAPGEDLGFAEAELVMKRKTPAPWTSSPEQDPAQPPQEDLELDPNDA